jgi:hypothetical protein
VTVDPENPVVKLCVAGMQAEAANQFAEARTLFEQAWSLRQTHLDACIAAHYLARLQETPERILEWNQKALVYADLARKETSVGSDLAGFYPSLYLNLGMSYEGTGDATMARHYYDLAAQKLEMLSGEYGDIVRRGVAAGLRRTASATAAERRELPDVGEETGGDP